MRPLFGRDRNSVKINTMLNFFKIKISLLVIVLSLTIGLVFNINLIQAAYDGNSSGYAWSEKFGWLSYNTTGDYGAENTQTYLDGYIWGEDIGYISLKRDSGTPDYGISVSYDGTEALLSGQVWGPQAGWIKFSADSSTYANTNASNYGVKIIASTGTFSGYAWGEDIGWINFNGSCDSGTADACAGGTYEVTTTFFPLSDGETCTFGDECDNSLCIDGACRAASSCGSYDGVACSSDAVAYDHATGGGVCLTGGTCDQTDPVTMDCSSAGTASCETDDSTYDTCSGRGGDACDTETGNGNFSQDGMCYDSGTNGCLTTGFIFYDGSNYASSTDMLTINYDHDSDADGKGCDSVVGSGGDFSVNGMVTESGAAGVCTTSGIVYLADSTNYFTASCSNGGGQQCDSSIIAHLTEPWVADGLCVAGSSCDTSGHVCFDTSTYQAACSSCSGGNSCTTSITSAYSASGICLADDSCDETSEAAKDCSYTEDDCSNYYASCSDVNDNDRCDSDITDGAYLDDGICSSSSCVATSTESTGSSNCEDTLDNDGDGVADLYDAGCNDTPSVPVLVSPANASTITDNSPTLSADYTDGTQAGYTYYRITSADTCVAGSNIVAAGRSAKTITTSESTIWTSPTSIGTSGTYYWCTRNYDSYLYSDWTAMGSFVLGASNDATTGFRLSPGGTGMNLNGVIIHD